MIAVVEDRWLPVGLNLARSSFMRARTDIRTHQETSPAVSHEDAE